MLSENQSLTVFFVAGTLFVFLLFVFILVYVYLHQAKVNRFNILIKDQELRKQQELFNAISEGEEREKKRFAEELNDGIGAKLSEIIKSIGYLKSSSGNPTPWNKISQEIHETIIELRAISQNFTPSFLVSQALSESLKNLVSYYNNKGKCKYHLDIADEEMVNSIPTVYRSTIYKITSEILNHISRQTTPSEATLHLVKNETHIQLKTEYNEPAMQGVKHTGNGLQDIRNRVEFYKGKFIVDLTATGTHIEIELPL